MSAKRLTATGIVAQRDKFKAERDKAVVYARLWYEIAVTLSSEAAVDAEFTRRTGVTLVKPEPEPKILTLPAAAPIKLISL